VVPASEEQARIKACLDAGARGFLPKRAAVENLPAAMKIIADGGRYVSMR